MASDFLKSFDKELLSIDGVATSSEPPRYWYSTGNLALNRIISGNFLKGIPQGRITDLAGPSGAGKSFLAANLVRSAQQSGAIILVVDSENALDDEFMTKIGVDVSSSNYKYVSVVTIPQVSRVVSAFIKAYKRECGTAADSPQVLILIDSLDMLITETEQVNYDKGETKGDQGQRNKQLKAMLRTFVQDIKHLNIAMVCTSQVYKNQDVTNGEGLWIVSDAVRYSCSQIVLLTKLKLRDKDRQVLGINMKCEGNKTRFTKPFQQVVVEVPYESGMDPYSGLVEAALALGVLTKAGSWYSIPGTDVKFQQKNIANVIDALLPALEQATDASVVVETTEFDEMTPAEVAAEITQPQAESPK